MSRALREQLEEVEHRIGEQRARLASVDPHFESAREELLRGLEPLRREVEAAEREQKHGALRLQQAQHQLQVLAIERGARFSRDRVGSGWVVLPGMLAAGAGAVWVVAQSVHLPLAVNVLGAGVTALLLGLVLGWRIWPRRLARASGDPEPVEATDSRSRRPWGATLVRGGLVSMVGGLAGIGIVDVFALRHPLTMRLVLLLGALLPGLLSIVRSRRQGPQASATAPHQD